MLNDLRAAAWYHYRGRCEVVVTGGGLQISSHPLELQYPAKADSHDLISRDLVRAPKVEVCHLSERLSSSESEFDIQGFMPQPHLPHPRIFLPHVAQSGRQASIFGDPKVATPKTRILRLLHSVSGFLRRCNYCSISWTSWVRYSALHSNHIKSQQYYLCSFHHLSHPIGEWIYPAPDWCGWL